MRCGNARSRLTSRFQLQGDHIIDIGKDPKVIQAILRHSDIATTLGFYVETSETESRDALDKLTALMG
jgi:site-specific recombinase XerD